MSKFGYEVHRTQFRKHISEELVFIEQLWMTVSLVSKLLKIFVVSSCMKLSHAVYAPKK